MKKKLKKQKFEDYNKRIEFWSDSIVLMNEDINELKARRSFDESSLSDWKDRQLSNFFWLGVWLLVLTLLVFFELGIIFWRH